MASEPVRAPNRLRFGEDFELDVSIYELRRSGRPLKLERIPMELLRLLIEQHGQLITREQIIEHIWGKDTFLDTDNSINAAIRKVRHVLKDDPVRPRFVQTITGRGYRFIAPVSPDEPPPGSAATLTAPVESEESDAGDTKGDPHYVARRKRLLAITVSILLIVAGAIAFQASRWRARASGSRVMLAVVPFTNLTGDVTQDYFSDGMTEEMIAQLGRTDPEHLGVIARTSVMHYKQDQKRLEQIGRELGVQYVLEGSVRRDSDKVRITAELIQVRDQTHVWSREYDRELSSLLTVQEEIAQQIADEIQLTLGEHKRSEPVLRPSLSPRSYQAYEFYLKGRYFLNKRTPESLQQAIEYFQRAVGKDPNYARAYAGLADTYALISGYNLTPRTESMPKARAAALRALDLDENLAEAHNALALIEEMYDWDWQSAEKEFRRAIQLDANYATAHHWYAEYLTLQGRFDEAFAESERARQLDPLSLIIATDDGAIFYFSRQYDRAIEKFRGVLEMEPDFPRAHLLTLAYAQKAMYAEALADIEKWQRVDDGPWIHAHLAYIYGRAGQRKRAQAELAKLQQLDRRRPLDPAPILLAQIGMGNNDKAFALLEKAYKARSTMLATLKVEPVYDPLRSDPRFQELMQRVGLSP